MPSEIRYRVLTDDGRLAEYMDLLLLSQNMQIPPNAITSIAAKYKVSYSIEQRI